MDNLEEKIISLRDMIKDSDNIVFFGGAGVSTESDIPDFRSSDGLFSKKLNKHFSPEQLVSHTFYVHYPEDFYAFYKDKLIYPYARPNKAHKALAYLEKIGKLRAVVTQNIDGLHQMAGSKNVLELHGSVNSNTCQSCGYNMDLKEFLDLEGLVPKCPKCGGSVKPDVVLYEESLNEDTIIKTIKAISEADMLIVGGTSLVVYPAAGFLDYFKGRHIVLINKAETSYDRRADLVINDSIGNVLDMAVKDL
ncbi:MAG: NAD-dependent protein deacylase [Peptostreptococcus stomatis]|uniref:NAD-dependent protein deacylase n=1 Tax=Peptostreptococcus stomatis TaxID=341694 RepID=UPI001A388BA0|nr:NAD-dependent protein deacylase [Peptostreptococcus stomatis]MBL6465386.1 NAD-dependent protein deacylase [Peptostreptococcus stomatis]